MSNFLIAVQHHKKGELDQALELYFEIIKQRKDCNAYHNIAVIFIQKRIYWKAEIYANLALQNGGVSKYFFDTFFKILKLNNNFNYVIKLKKYYGSINLNYDGDEINLENKYRKNEKENIKINSKKNLILKLINKFVIKKNYNEAIDYINLTKYNKTIVAKEIKAELYVKSRQLKNAVNEYLSIIEIEDGNLEALIALGSLFLTANNLKLAEFYLNKALIVSEKNINALTNLGTICKLKGQYEEALNYYFKALNLDVENVTIISSVASCFSQLENYEFAEYFYFKSLILDPSNFMALTNYGSLKYNKSNYFEAIELFNQSIRIKETAEAFNNLGLLYSNGMDHELALHNYEKAISINPLYYAARSNKLFLLNYYTNITAKNLISEYYRYWENVPPPKKLNESEKLLNEKIRIGFISGDFNSHPTFNFLYPVLLNIDKNNFEIYIYSNNPKIDLITKKYKAQVDYWRDIKPITDDDLSNLIRNDDIDILIDLSGHTGFNRLNVFRAKPAKKSATWIGYNYSTGLKEIDYFISDCHQVPVHSENYYSEKILRLPNTAYCFLPDNNKLREVAAAPFLTNKYIIFASFSRVIRMNDKVIFAWSRILHNVENSKLRINSRGVNSEYLQKIIYDKFLKNNISKDRLLLEFSDLNASLNSSDIVLDCFPHNSGTTLYESIYMGCPIITLKSELSLGRLGYSILQNLDLTELSANTIEEYIEIATNLAKDPTKLIWLRNNLRSRLINSDIMNYKKFTKQFQNSITNIFKG